MGEQSTTTTSGFKAIFWGGLIAGVLDLTSAFVIWGLRGVGPVRVAQGIATGLLGASSFQGGLPTAALGVACHFLIAYGAASVYYAPSTRLSVLTRHAIASGLAYGVAVYLFMNLVVIPLSATRARYTASAIVIGLIVHMLFVGLPISLAARRFSPRLRASA
jgi:uncharacterized membrane protein YagU involved in acid resistance